MGDFQRSPSKVWWSSDESSVWNHRSSSSSPRSQDSGFSDTETSPNAKEVITTPKNESPQRLNLIKNDLQIENTQNLSVNVKNKDTPKKAVLLESNAVIPPDIYYLSTPVRKIEIQVKSEPTRRSKFVKNHPKINRNLFKSIPKQPAQDTLEYNQYAQSDRYDREIQKTNFDSEVTYDKDISWSGDLSHDCENLLPISTKVNNSAPVISNNDDELASSASASDKSDDSDSELEYLFANALDSPKHTSTPIVNSNSGESIKRKLHMNLLMQYQNDRVPPMNIHYIEDGDALKKWIQETRHVYEPECMMTLQCKSISAELADKVSHLAAIATNSLRELLDHSHLIELEFDNFKNQRKHLKPLAQSLAGLVKEFISKFDRQQIPSISKYYEELRKQKSEDISKLVTELHIKWKYIQQILLDNEIKKIVDELEDPSSEIDVRAKLTGLTSLTLRNEWLMKSFASSGIIDILIVLCEKCQGSTVRALGLRALSTVCYNSSTIRQFEKASGLQLITDILTDASRPEPERSEAIALLAQITAPWIEDNHNIVGLPSHAASLIKSLTHFLQRTRCCQNVLLCTAALANLTTINSDCIYYILHENTIGILFDVLKCGTPVTSVYHLEQVATLIANMSSVECSRKHLASARAPEALLCFLQTNCFDDAIVKTLQQKSIIALSRLCNENSAAQQIVEMGGVEKLVKLCRDKHERYNNDAVLVATLTTLRKIADACGSAVINRQDVQELVAPRLLDSFLAYSTQNESLV